MNTVPRPLLVIQIQIRPASTQLSATSPGDGVIQDRPCTILAHGAARVGRKPAPDRSRRIPPFTSVAQASGSPLAMGQWPDQRGWSPILEDALAGRLHMRRLDTRGTAQ